MPDPQDNIVQQPDIGPAQINTPPYPGTTRIEGDTAFDIKGKALGKVDESGKAMGAATPQELDLSAGLSQPQQSQDLDLSAGLVSTAKPEATISARPNATVHEKLANWLDDAIGDVKYGSDGTWIGRLLSKMGAKGTYYGQSPRTAEIMGGPLTGPLEMMRGSLRTGLTPLGIESQEHPIKALAVGTNELIAGAGKTMGPAIIAQPEAIPAIVAGGVIQDASTKIAKHMGADDDTAELIGNTAGILAGTKVHTKLEVENFENAVNSRMNAESVYKTRTQELEIARQQAEFAQKKAVEMAQDEIEQSNSGKLSPQQMAELKQRTDMARTTASEAAKNADNAQKAFEVANESRAESIIRLKKYGRGIQDKAFKAERDAQDRVKKNYDSNRELLQKAVPAKSTDLFTPDEKGNYPKYDIVRSHLDAAKDRGMPVDTILDSRNAVEDSRQRIEDQVGQYLDKYKDESLTDDPAQSPKNVVQGKLDEMARLDGNFKDAMSHLSDFNITDLTVGEGQDLLTKLNDYMRSMKKAKNNWDIYNMIETDPRFASYYFMADALRDSLYGKLESHDVSGIREARKETAALIDYRNAADAQLRRNAGAVTVRGSGPQSAVRNLVARLTGKAIKGAGIATGAKMGGTTGAVLGGAVGEMIGEPVQDFISPSDLTRDEHVAKSMKTKGTTYKPAEITGLGTVAKPQEALPVPPKPVEGPTPLELTPRENTKLHSQLASHYGLTDLDERTYQELEDNLRQDVADRKAAGSKPTPEEKKLHDQVLEFDALDRGIRAKAEKTAKIKTPEQVKEEDRKTGDAAVLAGKTKQELGSLNKHLASLGREDESGFVSHSPASRAEAAPIDVQKLPEGLTVEDILRHEWAHIALGAIDGLDPIEIRAKGHSKASPTAAATAVFSLEKLIGDEGKVDPDRLAGVEAKWLTSKMAGPASHEVFQNMQYDDIKNMPGTRSDFRQARAVIRDVHPEFSDTQVEEAVKASYDRARNFLTKEHIANRVRANAAVREENLHPTLHASQGRVMQFVEDIRKAHDEYTGTDSGPDGGGAGEGGEKAEKSGEESKPKQPAKAIKEEKNAGGNRGGSESGARRTSGESATAGGGTGLKESEFTGTASPEQEVVEGAGLKYKGELVKGSNVHMFEHPEFPGKTAALQGPLTEEAVRTKMASKLKEFGVEPKAAAGNKTVATAASEYNVAAGRPEIDAAVKLHSPEFGKRVADAYEAMKHEPENPAVQKSYNAMAQEVKKQWDYATKQMGVKFEPWTKEGQPYANSKEMMADVKDNKHLYFYQGGDIKPESPMAKVDPETGLTYNDMFRAVHDLFGHAAHGFEFGPKGEENAYLVHRQMFPDEAIPALTSETRGQNSWVNFGKHLRNEAGEVAKKGEAGYVAPAERPYAEQKVGLLPEEFHGVKGETSDWASKIHGNLEKEPAGGVNPNSPDAASKRYGFEILPEARQAHESLSPEKFREYAARPEVKAALEAHPDVKLDWGTTGDRPKLNIGATTDDLNKATEMANKLDQRALWDNEKKEIVPVAGKGERTKFPEYPVEDRLRDLGSSEFAAPKGSTTPLMTEPLKIRKGGNQDISTVDVARAG